MAFALNDSSVDAMIGRLHMVTLGVRERVVKPATDFAGSIAMKRIIQVAVKAAIFSCTLLMLADSPGHAGSASAQFSVAARVIKSCKVSTEALAGNSTDGSATIAMNCQNNSPSTAAAGATPPSETVNVNYSVDDVPGIHGMEKIVTVNY